MKERRKNVYKKAGAVVALAFLYYIFTQATGLMIPCVFRLITGWKCPGCGISHMCVELLHFRLKEAFWCNPICFSLTPVCILILVRQSIRYIRTGKNELTKFENVLIVLSIILLLVYGVLRNVF